MDGLRNQGCSRGRDTLRSMSIDERIEAVAINLKLASRDIQDLRSAIRKHDITSQRDGENIRALARIAERHTRRSGRPRVVAAVQYQHEHR